MTLVYTSTLAGTDSHPGNKKHELTLPVNVSIINTSTETGIRPYTSMTNPPEFKFNVRPLGHNTLS